MTPNMKATFEWLKDQGFMRTKTRFPSIAAVASVLRDVNREIARTCDFAEDESCDVRLQVYPDGAWTIRMGDSSYDLDHRGYWGSSSLDGRRFDSTDMARDLIDQAREQYACDGGI